MTVFVADEQSRPVDLDRIRALAAHIRREERVPEDMELNVLCVTPEAMTALNLQHMGGTGPTDVLAFPMDEPGESVAGQPAILGDVVVCPDVAARQAARRSVALPDELDLLVTHGILHLLGHDHAEPDDRRTMFTRTDELLRAFGSRGRSSQAPDEPDTGGA